MPPDQGKMGLKNFCSTTRLQSKLSVDSSFGILWRGLLDSDVLILSRYVELELKKGTGAEDLNQRECTSTQDDNQPLLNS